MTRRAIAKFDRQHTRIYHAADVLATQGEVLTQKLAEIDRKKKEMDARVQDLERLAAAGDG